MLENVRINVLIIDDSLVIRAMLSGLIEQAPGFKVIGTASSAEEASRIILDKHVDVVTLDIDMPGIDGLTYLQTLNARRIPAVMLSGRTAEGSEARINALVLGAAACFDKSKAMTHSADMIALLRAAAHHHVRLSRADSAALFKARREAPSSSAVA